jgi:hypothetical protein
MTGDSAVPLIVDGTQIVIVSYKFFYEVMLFV